jgi:hypothetical protein
LEALRKSGAAGSHRDKKKEMKLGKVKHKGKTMDESIYTNPAGGELSRIGRILMDKSITVKDDALSNVLGRVGDELTRYGEPGGASSIDELCKKARCNKESLMKMMKWAQQQKDTSLDKVKDPDPKPEDDEDDDKKESMASETSIGHVDDERHMIRKELYQHAKYAKELFTMLEDLPEDSDFPHWWQSKVTKSLQMLSKAKHYLENELAVPDSEAMESVAPVSEALLESVGKEITEDEFEKLAEKKDACYHKVKARYKVWPSAYASGALVQCRKKGAKNWGKSKD